MTMRDNAVVFGVALMGLSRGFGDLNAWFRPDLPVEKGLDVCRLCYRQPGL